MTPVDEIDALVARHTELRLPMTHFLKEAPRHTVVVPVFSISRTPVTRAQWNAVAGTAGLPDVPPDKTMILVNGVTWDDAQRSCTALSEATWLPVHLPTEVKWERAACCDDAREYPWGNVWNPHAAKNAAHGVGGPEPVGSLPAGASPFGVLDLAGSVDVWTRDIFARYPGAPDGVRAVEAWASDHHMTRGGRFTQDRDVARRTRRHTLYDDLGAGVRLVLGPGA